jgi:hypothetical protein
MVAIFLSYWPFVLAAVLAGVAVGWWYQDPRSADDVTAWLERADDES